MFILCSESKSTQIMFDIESKKSNNKIHNMQII